MGQTVIALSASARIQCISDQLPKHSNQEEEVDECLQIESEELEKEQIEEKEGRQILTFHLLCKDNRSYEAYPLSLTHRCTTWHCFCQLGIVRCKLLDVHFTYLP